MKRRHLFLLKMCVRRHLCHSSLASAGVICLLLLWSSLEFFDWTICWFFSRVSVQRAANGSLVGRWLLVFMRGSSSISWSLRAIQFCRPICTFFSKRVSRVPIKTVRYHQLFSQGEFWSWSRKHFHLFRTSREEFTLSNWLEKPPLNKSSRCPFSSIHCYLFTTKFLWLLLFRRKTRIDNIPKISIFCCQGQRIKNPSQLWLLRVEWIDTIEMNNCTIQISVSILLIILRSTCVTMGLNHRSHGKDLRL